MNRTVRGTPRVAYTLSWLLALGSVALSLAQPANNNSNDRFPTGGPDDGPPPFGPPPGMADGNGGGPGGRGFSGPPMGGVQETRPLVKQFDKDGNQRLDSTERQAALEFLKKDNAQGGGRRGPGGRPGFGGGPRPGPGGFGGQRAAVPAQPGPKVAVADAKNYADAPLYDLAAYRTFFLEFEDANWEEQLAAFKYTDIEVPAKLTVDGKVYPDVGVHFRGMSSFMMIQEGQKRSLHISMDYAHENQNLGGYRTLNLLNSHEDPSFLRAVLSYEIERAYLPAPKANFSRVVINGESWGVYVNAQAYNKEFIKDWYGTTKGARWKVPGSPNGQGGLRYLGDEAAPYKRIFEIKTKDDAKSWADLIRLCKVLNETPADQLEAALAPILDVDGTLKFLALENALVNNDGYWVRASDYSIYQDAQGRFHILPYDSNETFARAMSGPGGPGGGRFGRRGPGGGGPEGGGGFGRPEGGPAAEARAGGAGGAGSAPVANGPAAQLDPLVGLNDASKPLRSKLLAVPALRARYLGYVKDIAERWLDWQKLGPLAEKYHALIADDVKADTRKLDSTEDFEKSLTLADAPKSEERVERFRGPGPGGPALGLKSFADQRRAYLLGYQDKTAAAK